MRRLPGVRDDFAADNVQDYSPKEAIKVTWTCKDCGIVTGRFRTRCPEHAKANRRRLLGRRLLRFILKKRPWLKKSAA